MKMVNRNIEDLPVEVLVAVLKYLSFEDILKNCLRTCRRWRGISVKFFIAPQLVERSKLDEDLKVALYNKGWTEDCTNEDLITTLSEKFEPNKCGKYSWGIKGFNTP